MSYIDMAIWVSKDASGRKEHRQMTLNNFLLSLIPQNFKIMLFKNCLSIFFLNFPCIIYRQNNEG